MPRGYAMKSHLISSYARIALAATAALLMTACAHVRDDYDPYPYHSPRASYYDYWYYPAVGSYYDTRTRYYIYYERDRWVRAHTLPRHMRPHLGRHVIVRSPHDRPYEQHQRHREQYTPERYKRLPADGRGNDVWLGAPRREMPARDRDDRHKDIQNRDKNGKVAPRDRPTDRAPGLVHEDSRPRDQEPRSRQLQYVKPQPREVPPQKPNTRFQATPDRRESPVSAAPGGRENRVQEREVRKDDRRDRSRDGDVRRGNGRDGNAHDADARIH